MRYEHLLAKSRRKNVPSQTIRKHTAEVMAAAAQLVEVTGIAQLRVLGLEPDKWLDRFRYDMQICSLVHDMGKANDHFQGMVSDPPQRDGPQGLRHEAVSYLIARKPEMNAWLGSLLPDPERIALVLWAVAGHHRKFPPDAAPDGAGSEMRLFLDHEDFQKTLRLGTERLGLPEPPTLSSETLRLTTLDGIFRELHKASREAEAAFAKLSPEEKRYLAALKACLICADVAGSIGWRGTERMTDWIPRAFARRPTPEQLRALVANKLKGDPPREFQTEVAARTEPIVYVKAGCGSGKTAAAYLWAAEQAPNKRLFFCYPTTGTATEGYRDYLCDASLEAELVHGRAAVDRRLFQSEAPADAPISTLGDDERDVVPEGNAPRRPFAAADDAAGALEQWSTPIVSCTVDTVLGLVQNNRRGLYAWPSIADSACVFDEIHSYDDALFQALLRFLTDVPGVKCLLMTASLPDVRLKELEKVVEKRGIAALQPVSGPQKLEQVKRYRREHEESAEAAWQRVEEICRDGGKILWVVNTVKEALDLAADSRCEKLKPILYHSRFRYIDRVERHGEVIAAFKKDGPAFAIATQVAEMSLDLSADLLVTQLAPIPALIQRLGRLNRRAKEDGSSGTRPFLVYEPSGHLPYAEEDLEEARIWLDKIASSEDAISQSTLVDPKCWDQTTSRIAAPSSQHIWLDGGFHTEPWPLREGSPGIDIILEEDAAAIRRGEKLPEEVRIPMPPVPRQWNWKDWDEIAFCKVPPKHTTSYDSTKGAQWKAD